MKPGRVDPRPFDVSISDPKKRIEAYLQRYQGDKTYDGFESLLMRQVKVTSARRRASPADDGEAFTVFELDVVPGLCNPMGNMHGGAVATLADMATTMATAPVSSPGFWEFGGVSRTLQVTYLKPLPVDTTVVVECTLRSIGKRLSATQCVIKSKVDGTILALAEHGKAALSSQDESINCRP